MRFLIIILSFILTGLPLFAHASDLGSVPSVDMQAKSEYVNAIKSRAVADDLADDVTWRSLLHYRDDIFAPSGYSSYVDDTSYFYAADGNTNADSELIATIEQIFSTDDLGNDHAQCRFVYRFEWLVSRLEIETQYLPDMNCVDYQQWRKQVNAHSVSLIFPATALNSPSSMFGHTLLRFDPEGVEKGSDWLSWALNFGAKINNDDNSIFFAVRGLAGGYPGVYNMMRYFEKIKEYNRMENRDIWEYRLDFTPLEVNLMLTHIWELKDINFDYYFFDENCAFRLLELMELVRPELDLTSQFKLNAIPTNTVRAVVNAGLVEETDFRPSELSELRTRIHSLPEPLQKMGHHLTNDIAVLESADYLALTKEQQGEVVQVAYSYLRYIQLQSTRDPVKAKRSYQLLLALNDLSSSEVHVERPAAPETGHKTTMASVVLGERDSRSYEQIDFRITYHDLLDNQEGYLRGAQIVLGNTVLRHYDGENVKLNRFDLVDITSLSERNMFLSPFSWRVQVGYERVSHGDDDTGVLQVNGGAGYTFELSDNSVFYGMLTGRVEHNNRYDNFVEPAYGATTGLLNYSFIGAQKLDVDGYKFLNGDYRVKASFNQNIDIAINHAIRITLGQEWNKRENFFDASVGYRYYF